MDEFDLDSVINPEHEQNAESFTAYLESASLIGESTILEYLKSNTLGCFIGQRPEINIRFNGNHSTKLGQIAAAIQSDLDQSDITSAESTTVLFHVTLGSLNTRDDILESDFRRMAKHAEKWREHFTGYVDQEKLEKLKTGEQTYNDAWERHIKRKEFLNEDKLNEIRHTLLGVFKSDEMQLALTKLNGRLAITGDKVNKNTLLEIQVVF